MAQPTQPQPGIAVQTMTGYQQIEQEFFITLSFAVGPVNFVCFLSMDHARQFVKGVREALDTAAVQIIKPPSMLAEN